MFRTQRRHNPDTGVAYPWLVRHTAMVNHFYAFDDDFGSFFIKFCSYFPYTAKVCVNGHHWAQARRPRGGSPSRQALDNGFVWTDEPKRLQQTCDRLGPRQIEPFLHKWLRRLPHPFSGADRRAGYRYDATDRGERHTT